MLSRLRVLDDAVAADPRRFLAHALALAGLLYAALGSGLWLWSVVTFDRADTSDLADAVLLCPWSALPLLLVLRGGAPRGVGLVVSIAALAQFAAARGSWGLELAYLPLALVGLLLLLLGGPRRR